MAALATLRVSTGFCFEGMADRGNSNQQRGFCIGSATIPPLLQPANQEVALLSAAAREPLQRTGVRIQGQAVCGLGDRPLALQKPGQTTSGLVSRRRCQCQASKAGSTSKTGSASKSASKSASRSGSKSGLGSEPDMGRPIRRARVSTRKPKTEKEPAVKKVNKVAKASENEEPAVNGNGNGAVAPKEPDVIEKEPSNGIAAVGSGRPEVTEKEPFFEAAAFGGGWPEVTETEPFFGTAAFGGGRPDEPQKEPFFGSAGVGSGWLDVEKEPFFGVGGGRPEGEKEPFFGTAAFGGGRPEEPEKEPFFGTAAVDSGRPEGEKEPFFGSAAFGGGRPEEPEMESLFGTAAVDSGRREVTEKEPFFGSAAFGGGRPEVEKEPFFGTAAFGGGRPEEPQKEPFFGTAAVDSGRPEVEKEPFFGTAAFGGGRPEEPQKEPFFGTAAVDSGRPEEPEKEPFFGTAAFGGGRPEVEKEPFFGSAAGGGGWPDLTATVPFFGTAAVVARGPETTGNEPINGTAAVGLGRPEVTEREPFFGTADVVAGGPGATGNEAPNGKAAVVARGPGVTEKEPFFGTVARGPETTRNEPANGRAAAVARGPETTGNEPPTKNKFRSSWDAKDSQGRTYIEQLGKQSENVNIVVGAKAGMVDDLFVGDFLGKESDIVFKYRQKVTRQFGHIHGDYYIAPAFMDKVVTHIAKNFLSNEIQARVPLILGVWGGKGQGKSFQTELIFKALGLEPVIMSAGEMEGEWAGEPARLIRDRYRAAGQVIKVHGKMSALVINDIDAGAGRFENTQMTVNTQMVMGTLMNLADNPTRVSTGQEYREADEVPRVPIILTGNDLTTLWAPLIRDGRMDKFYWTPTREDLINIVTVMYKKDGLEMSDIVKLVDTFPAQALDFYGAMRSRTYDTQVKKWLDSMGGPENLRNIFPVKPGKDYPVLDHYQQTLENLIVAGRELVEEQRLVTEIRLSEEYMNSPVEMVGGGISTSAS